MNNFYLNITILFSFLLIFGGCRSDITQISGQIDNGHFSDITLVFPKLHYKYASEDAIYLTTDSDGRFNFTIDIEKPKILHLRAFGYEYPVFIEPGRHLKLNANRNSFPLDTQVRGFGNDYNTRLQSFLAKSQQFDRHLATERRKMLRNDEHELFNVHRVRIQSAKEYLSGTPFAFLIKKYIGEFLVHRLEEIGANKNIPNYSVNAARSYVLKEAMEYDFFTYNSLIAQRAGIRDFADAWVKTFGIQTQLEEELRRSLTENDWKHLGFQQANDARKMLLDYIDDKDALAHAQMYLNAERITEAPFQYAIDYLLDFNVNFSEYNSYVSFLNNLYKEVEKVQPGNRAINFELEDVQGDTIKLSNLKGRYVLLDFWASWCTPCLVEFPYMEELYQKYSKYDLEIVSISIDEDIQNWKNAIDRFEHPWIQIHAKGGFNNELFNTYRAGGVPYYILIDRNGYIVSNNTIRPSFNLIDVFEDLLLNELDHTYVMQ